jgi:hypothetical protein
MNVNDVRIAVGFDIQLFRGIVNFLYEQGLIPASFTDPSGSVDVQLDLPQIEVDDPGGSPVLVLHTTGSFSVGGGTPNNFDARIALEPFVRAKAGQAPLAALRVDKLLEITPSNLGLLFDVIASAFLDDVLSNMDLPLFDPLIGQIESAFFADGAAPSRDQWTADFYLGKTDELEHVKVGFPPGRPDLPRVDESTPIPTTSALIATLALPGESAAFSDAVSIVPEATGIQILISRSTMDVILAAQAAAMVGTEIEGGTITSLSMQMHNLGIEIGGKAEKDPVDIEWDGILLIFFRKRYALQTSGTIRWHDGFVEVFASGIDVEIDVPWWVTFLRVLGGVFLGPIFWVLDATLIQPKLDKADEAPDLVRSAFREEVTAALRAMIASVSNLGDAADAPVIVFGHDAWVLNGHYTTSLIALAGVNPTTIDEVQYDAFEVKGASGQSVGLLRMGTGHLLHPEEAGRLMKSGIVRVPGYHGVEAPYGFYVRANPNTDLSDNLVDPDLIVVK